MWSEGQWEASKKVTWKGDIRPTDIYIYIYKLTLWKNRPKGRFIDYFWSLWFFKKIMKMCTVCGKGHFYLLSHTVHLFVNISFLLYWLAEGLLEGAKTENMVCEEFNRDFFYYLVQAGLINITRIWLSIDVYSSNQMFSNIHIKTIFQF